MDATIFVLALLFPVAVLVSNLWLRTTVQRAVNHRYDRKIEEVRSDLRSAEERFRSQLREKESEIAALRDGAMAHRAQRHALVDKRRLEAIERLWVATKELAALKYVSTLGTIIKFEEAAKRTKNDPDLRELFKTMAGPAFENNGPIGAAENEQPFLPPLSWALFSAYKAVLTFAAARWKLLVYGLGEEDLLNAEGLRKLLIETFPERADWINQADVSSFHYLVDELEAKLLTEIRKALAGHEDDEEAVRRAAAISKYAVANASLQQSQAEAQIPASLIQTDPKQSPLDR